MNNKIIITGGAGIVGFNLVQALIDNKYKNVHVIDKHFFNIKMLKKIFPSVTIHCCDLSITGDWGSIFTKGSKVVIMHAQISSLKWRDFELNTIESTKNLIKVLKQKSIKPSDITHISSSVIHSKSEDFYVKSKTNQENLIKNFSSNILILRPTLMFGMFDRKHLGWLSEFMDKSPIFPIPGNGEYLRQPLYVGDFVKIILSSIKTSQKGTMDISGKEVLSYIDIIREIKKNKKSKVWIAKIPYFLFFLLLKIWSFVDRNPPFTVYQLKALIIPELFPKYDWEEKFKIKATRFKLAAKTTYGNNKYQHVKLRF